MKKSVVAILSSLGLVTISSFVFFTSSTLPETRTVELKGEVGTIIRDGNLVFQRVADAADPAKNNVSEITPLASTEGFTVTLDGNTSLTKQFNLAGDYRYWKVWIQNTGTSSIMYSTTGPENGKVYTIPAGETWNVYSTQPWKTGTYNANFTSGSGMKGKAASRTFAELDIK